MASSDILPYIFDPESEDETEKTHSKSDSSKLTVRRFRKSKRIYIGGVLKRWREFRKLQGIKTDEELAKFFLDSQPSSCIVHGCGKKSEAYVRTLHQFPEDLETVKVWKEFVQKTTTEWDGQVSPWKKICSEHFEPSCYANHTAWLMRSVQKLELRDEFQVPTIYPTEETSSHDAGSLDQPQQAAVGGIEPTRIPESPNQNTKVVEGNAQQPTTLQLPSLELHQTPLSVPSFCVTPLVLYTAPAAPYQVQPGLTGSVNVVGEKSWKSKGCQTESVTFADGNGHIIKPRLPKDETAEDTYSRDSDVCDEDEDVSRRFRMSELFMECVEEELEPWQKQVPRVDLIEDDDDEPIFVGVLSDIKTDEPNPAPQNKMVAVTDLKSPQPVVAPAPMVMPMTVPATQGKTAPSILTTVAPQPVIVNNQGFIVATPQLANSTEFLATLGAQYPPGTSFTIVPAPQQQRMFHHVPSTAPLPSAIHRPQVQQIRNNVVTLSHVQSPALFSTQTSQQQAKRPIAQLVKTTAVKPATVKDINNKDQSSVRQGLPSKEVEPVAKKLKLDSAKVMARTDNDLIKCPKCPEGFFSPEAQKIHVMNCHGNVESQTPNLCGNKLIMRVSDFYYGRFEGFAKTQTEKTNVSFKCQSCLKILKNNIRFMNHMKHHLELEKQNSESWDSHTTCQHCYRQYLTPFQLQCHIESAHSPIESSTNCKICELAFESEQVLLEHMKGNHKPGEMPYVCQVCNYRSSFFSDVESHFRTAHVNTKDLLCPFCLKIARSSHVYMQHYMKHQRKGIYRCGKCRLNFLTYKEKIDHRTHGHKTYRRPEALEGLPPGTKVTIRASLTGTSSSTPLPSDRAAITVYSEALNVSQFKPPVSLLKAKINEPKEGKRKAVQSKTKKEDRRISQHNLSLKDLSVGKDHYTCIECNADVDDFFLHFPIFSHCGACSYRTSCKVSIGNHMIKYHSTISKNRFNKKDHKKNGTVAGFKLTLICVNCELLVDASGGDLMTKHLTDNPDHVCKIVQEKGVVESRSQLSSQQPLVEKLKESDLKPAFANVGPTDDHKKDSEETSSQNESKTEMSSLLNVSSSISADLGLNL